MSEQIISDVDFCTTQLNEVRRQLELFRRGIRVRRGVPGQFSDDVTNEHVARLEEQFVYWTRRLEIAEGLG